VECGPFFRNKRDSKALPLLAQKTRNAAGRIGRESMPEKTAPIRIAVHLPEQYVRAMFDPLVDNGRGLLQQRCRLIWQTKKEES
jgi:hypothetical protein